MSDASAYDLVNLAYGGNLVPIVAHDPQGWQLLARALGQSACLDLVVAFEAVVKVRFF